MELFKINWKALEGYRRKAILLVGLLGLSGLLEGIVLLTLIPILNSGISVDIKNQKWFQFAHNFGITSENILYVAFFSFISFGLLSAVIKFLAEAGILKLRTQLEESYRKKISKVLLKMDWTFFHSMRLGDINKAILMEPLYAAQGVWHFILGLGAIFIAFFFSFTAFIISAKMTTITFVFVIIVGSGYRLAEKRAIKHAQRWTSTGTSIGDQVTEIFGNLKFFRSTGRTIPAKEKAESIFDQHRQNFFWSQVYNILMVAIYQAAGILFLGALLAFSLLTYKLPITDIVVLLAVFYRMVPRLRSVQECFYSSRIFQTEYLSWVKRYDFISAHQENNKGDIFPEFNEAITVKNLYFKYPNSDKPVLNGINFSLKKRQCIALVGESGSGKSTLTDLLTGLLTPNKGEILLDNVPFNKLELDQWRMEIGLVMQESPIFHTTILENISWGCPNPNPELAQRCARLAHAWEFIEKFPEGLSTILGEKGGRLSVGQKQRIALARALYREPSLLILDEATSALDGESEKIIQDSLKTLKGEFGILMVAHRLKTVQLADEILVLVEGRILERGSWSELINRPFGAFRKMAELQGLVKALR